MSFLKYIFFFSQCWWQFRSHTSNESDTQLHRSRGMEAAGHL